MLAIRREERFMNEEFMVLKNMIKDEVAKLKLVLWLIFAAIVFLCVLKIYTYLELSDDNYHFYMNAKTSLEQIHNIKIDSYDGSIERDLSTEERLIRKSHKRWHLRHLFK